MKANDRPAKTIALGKKRYVIIYGILGWGLLTAVLYNTFMLMTEKVYVHTVIFNFVMFSVAGIFVGLLSWTRLEKKAAKITPDTGK
jgi:hypothetical protein